MVKFILFVLVTDNYTMENARSVIKRMKFTGLKWILMEEVGESIANSEVEKEVVVKVIKNEEGQKGKKTLK